MFSWAFARCYRGRTGVVGLGGNDLAILFYLYSSKISFTIYSVANFRIFRDKGYCQFSVLVFFPPEYSPPPPSPKRVETCSVYVLHTIQNFRAGKEFHHLREFKGSKKTQSAGFPPLYSSCHSSHFLGPQLSRRLCRGSQYTYVIG